MVQAIEMENCRIDILYWFKNYAWTDKNTSLFNSSDPWVIPFIPFPFQEEAILEMRESIMEGTKPVNERTKLTNIIVEKSRQMWLSWIIIAVFVYWFVFHNMKFHCISQKEDLVDKIWDMKSLFEKARFIIRNLPEWMIPKGFSKDSGWWGNKYMSLSREDGTWAITWESANPNASRSGTYNAILLDEFAFQSNANTINSAAASATPCRIFNSTPNWEGNEFYRMRRMAIERIDENKQKLPPELKLLRYHRSQHPLYTKEWYANKIKGMDSQMIAQELEINYNTALIGRVYNDFSSSESDISYDHDAPLYIAIDNSHGGMDPHAMILAQLIDNNIHIIDTLEINCSVTDMANICVGEVKCEINNRQLDFIERYKKYNFRRATFISDPYDTHATLNQSTIFEEYRKVKIYLNTPQERKKKEQIMKTRAELYRVKYNAYCYDFASAIMNARYPERKEGTNNTNPTEIPIHDWTSHYRSALEYLIQFLSENTTANKPKVAADHRPTRDMLTGRLTYHLQDDRVKRNKVTWELVYQNT